MDETIKRRLNILIYLAKVDGKFHKAEKTLLQDFVKEHNLNASEFKALMSNNEKLETGKIIDKEEMLFLALKVINADKFLDKKELDFCKDLAIQYGYKEGLIDVFNNQNLTRENFDSEIAKWKV